MIDDLETNGLESANIQRLEEIKECYLNRGEFRKANAIELLIKNYFDDTDDQPTN